MRPSPVLVHVVPAILLRLASCIPEVAAAGTKLWKDLTFVQFSADAYRYRDAIQFGNAKLVLLQEIPGSIHFEVLSLASSPGRTEAEPQRVPDPGPECIGLS
jgi:hypothetical protein